MAMSNKCAECDGEWCSLIRKRDYDSLADKLCEKYGCQHLSERGRRIPAFISMRHEIDEGYRDGEDRVKIKNVYTKLLQEKDFKGTFKCSSARIAGTEKELIRPLYNLDVLEWICRTHNFFRYITNLNNLKKIFPDCDEETLVIEHANAKKWLSPQVQVLCRLRKRYSSGLELPPMYDLARLERGWPTRDAPPEGGKTT